MIVVMTANIPPGRSIVLLDVDGTLIDSFPGIRAGFLHALDEVGVAHPDEEFTARIAGPPMEETFAKLGLDAATVARAFESYMAYTRDGGWNEAEAFAGTVELVNRLADDGYLICTATSKGENFARAILERTGILPRIDFLGAAEEYGPRRGKAAVIAHVLDTVGLRGRESDILMVGDRSHDIEGAAHFGIDTVAVTWGYGFAEEWAAARYTAASPQELEKVVHDWSGRR